jgi:hypothetical protein
MPLNRSAAMKSVVVLMAALLSGCASLAAQRHYAAFQEASAIAEECRNKRVAGQIKNQVGSIECSNDRMRQVIAASGYPHMDLVDLFLANRLVLARKIDNGELTPEDAELQEAELKTRIASEEQRRNVVAYQAQLQAHQNFQNSLNMLNYNLQQQQNRDMLMHQPPVTCQNFGTIVQCY